METPLAVRLAYERGLSINKNGTKVLTIEIPIRTVGNAIPFHINGYPIENDSEELSTFLAALGHYASKQRKREEHQRLKDVA